MFKIYHFQEHLAGAVVCPSDEDSRTFTISAASGGTLKLRASNARTRQEWVDGLRNIAECHTQVNRSFQNNFYPCIAYIFTNSLCVQSLGSQFVLLPPRESLAAFDALAEARRQLQNTESW